MAFILIVFKYDQQNQDYFRRECLLVITRYFTSSEQAFTGRIGTYNNAQLLMDILVTLIN